MKKTVLITGASSGIGAALAREFARRGYSLGLMARRTDRLEALQKELLALQNDEPIQVEIAALDINDTQAVSQVIPELAERLGGMHLFIANAGISSSRQPGDRFEQEAQVLQTNVIATIQTLLVSADYFSAKGAGHIVTISSVASHRGIPGNGAYCASKAALATYAEALRGELAPQVQLTDIQPGYILTELNDKLKDRPFVISATKGARLMVDQIELKRRVAIVPAMPWRFVVWLMRRLPHSIWESFFKKVPY